MPVAVSWVIQNKSSSWTGLYVSEPMYTFMAIEGQPIAMFILYWSIWWQISLNWVPPNILYCGIWAKYMALSVDTDCYYYCSVIVFAVNVVVAYCYCCFDVVVVVLLLLLSFSPSTCGTSHQYRSSTPSLSMHFSMHFSLFLNVCWNPQ